MTVTAPYGSWRSPISAADLAVSGHPISGAAWVGDDIWWLELRTHEGGRLAVRTRNAERAPVDILPPPWNARTRVHEYGGGAWTVTASRALVFAEFTDQRLYRLDAGSDTPAPLTPADQGFRFGEISVRGHEIIAVRETCIGENILRDIVAVPLDGSAAETQDPIRSIVSGSHFLAYPRFSPDGSRLAWLAWDHPQMPWDGTELRVAEVENGLAGPITVLAGSTTNAVLQPEWVDNESLTAISDQDGWWNLIRVTLSGTVTKLHEEQAEYGGPLWTLGTRWYEPLDDGRLLAIRTLGDDSLVILNPGSAATTSIVTPLTTISLGARNRTRVLLIGGSSTLATGLRTLDLSSGSLENVRLAIDELPDAAYFPIAEPRTFVAAREVHTFVYPPRNPEFVAAKSELPPYIAFVHGGPTARVSATVNPFIAYFTSRGIGVVDVNYGGSTGYGRQYRERLRGEWGVVDVEDTIATVLGLADAGLADRNRLAIRGGSAGGWTVLAALTTTDVFAAGTSYFGISELKQFARDTHDFESHYLDGLVGALPEAEKLYDSRTPLNNVHQLSTPVLLLQGLDDPIVPPSQAELFRDALVEGGIRHAYIAYENESHGFRQMETIVSATEAELSFYGQVMGFEPADIPTLRLSK